MAGRLDGVQLEYVDTLDKAMACKRWLGERRQALGVDIETTGLSPYEPGAAIRLIQFGDTQTGWAMSWDLWKGLALEIMQSWEGDFVGHNIGAFDSSWVEHHSGFRFPRHRLHDTMLAAHIIDPLGPGGLKPLSRRLVDSRADAGQQALDDAMHKNKWTWATVPVDFTPYWCVPLDTEILTRDGWKTYDLVTADDETLGYDNGLLVWTPITGTQQYDDAPLVRVGNSRWSAECTPDHRWLYQMEHTSHGVYDGYGDVQLAPLSHIQTKRHARLVLTGYAVGGGSSITPDEARIIAWLQTDGYIHWQRPRSSPNPGIYQSVDKFADEVRALLAREGAYVSERVMGINAATGNTNLRFQVRAGYVTDLWERAGLHDRGPLAMVLALSQPARAAWLDAVVQADGVTRGAKAKLPRTTVNKRSGHLHDAIVLAAYLEGHLPTVHQHGENSMTIGFGSLKRPTFQKHQPQPIGRAPVWCPTTGLGTWTARTRDGRVFVTGNSYGALDPVLTTRLHERFQQKVGPGTEWAEVYQLELAVRGICTRMQQRGMRLDTEYARAKSEELLAYAEGLRAWCKTHYGVSISSGAQLTKVFQGMGVEFDIYSEKTGAPSTDKHQLAIFGNGEHAEAAQLAQAVTNYRKAVRFGGDYLQKFGDLAVPGPDGDIIHPSIRTLGARTSRMAVATPPAQQLPKNDTTIRRAFIPREGNVIITTDFAQVEMRMLAHFSKDKDLQQAFRTADETGGDFFVEVGKDVYSAPDFDKKDKRRGLIKNVCVPLTTQILTQRGWLSHDEVRVGDLTVGYNWDTGMSEWTGITDVIHLDSAPLMEVHSRHTVLTTTPDHRWVVRRRRPDRTLWRRTSELSSEDRIVLATPCMTTPGTRPPDITTAEAALLGWILTDGQLKITPRTMTTSQGWDGRRQSVIGFIRQSKPRTVAVIQATIAAAGYETTVRTSPPKGRSNHPHTIWSFKAPQLRTLCRETALLTESGDRPDPVMFAAQFTPAQRAAILEAMLLADGSNPRAGGQELFYKSDVWTIEVFRSLLYLNGTASSTTIRPASQSQWQKKDNYAVSSWASSILGMQKKSVRQLEDAPVWCVKTGLGTWTMRQDRDQAIMLTGNCYGLAYGAGTAKMAESAGVPVDQMKAAVDALTSRFPGIRAFMKEVEHLGVQRERTTGQGYIVTPYGRRLPCDEGKAYTLTNYSLQGHAAEYFKRSLIALDAAGWGDAMLLPVHDEIVMDLPAGDAEQALHDVPKIMENRTDYGVDILAESDGPFAAWGGYRSLS